MNDEDQIIDFPKIKSPFVRKEIDGKYLCTPEIEEGYEWVFEDPTVLAVDKLHGTNICCIFKNGVLQHIDNRTNRLILSPRISTGLKTETFRAIEGVLRAISMEWIEDKFTGRVYGELVGPSINGNIHELSHHFFVPFDYLKKRCKWNSWSANKYPKTFDVIKEWFKYLPSLFTNRMAKTITSIGEGIVFYGPEGKMAKLRKDMFL